MPTTLLRGPPDFQTLRRPWRLAEFALTSVSTFSQAETLSLQDPDFHHFFQNQIKSKSDVRCFDEFFAFVSFWFSSVIICQCNIS